MPARKFTQAQPATTLQVEYADALLAASPVELEDLTAEACSEAMKDYAVGAWVMVPCYHCDGKPPGYSVCSTCKGANWLARPLRMCRECYGEGEVEVHGMGRPGDLEKTWTREPCLLCEGTGKVIAYGEGGS